MAVSTRQALLQALSAAGGSYVSGQQLAETLGVSRAAVHTAYGKSSAFPTDFMTPLAAIVPKVTIWATWSRPYFSFT